MPSGSAAAMAAPAEAFCKAPCSHHSTPVGSAAGSVTATPAVAWPGMQAFYELRCCERQPAVSLQGSCSVSFRVSYPAHASLMSWLMQARLQPPAPLPAHAVLSPVQTNPPSEATATAAPFVNTTTANTVFLAAGEDSRHNLIQHFTSSSVSAHATLQLVSHVLPAPHCK
jgi:hypothetical protein